MNARALAPKRPTLLDPADEAAMEAVLAQTIAALRRVGLVYDGTRTMTMRDWAAEIERVAQPIEDAERVSA